MDETFDVVVSSDRSGSRPDDVELATLASLGVTWHLVQAFTIDDATRHASAHPNVTDASRRRGGEPAASQ
jgi:hypothetical protein